MATRRPAFRVEKVRSQVKLLRDNRRGGRNAFAIRTPAGGQVSKAMLEEWISDSRDRTALGPIIDVYIQQLCHGVNQMRGLIGPRAAPDAMRAVLSMPQSFYTRLLLPAADPNTGSALLRAAGISAAEFAQLEYFFVPVEFNEHSSLVAISPRNGTVEYLDSTRRNPRAVCRILHRMIRFLVHELGSLPPGPRGRAWMFLREQGPRQRTPADCGNFTCFFAKALALHLPLTPVTDLGQGPTPLSEDKEMKLRLVDDLLLSVGNRWSARTMPFGDEDPLMRHADGLPNGSEPQHSVFWDVPEQDLFEIRYIRSRTGRFDHLTVPQLIVWCARHPPLPDGRGSLVPSFDGHTTVSLPPSTHRDFVRWIELRVMDIENADFP